MKDMTTEPSDTLKRAVATHHKAKTAEENARQQVYVAILDDLEAGVRQTDICRATGYTREHIRQLAKKRAAGEI